MAVINYRSFDDFLTVLPPDEQELSLFLHDLILAAEPKIKVKFSYGAPFFRLRSPICFLWPGSLTWLGGGYDPGHVKMGFTRGHLLENGASFFKMEGRKQMSQAIFRSIEEVPEQAVLEILSEAILLDEQLFLAKKTR